MDSNPAVRTKAILTLHKLAHGGNDLAVKILHTVYANPSENYQVKLHSFQSASLCFTTLFLDCVLISFPFEFDITLAK